MTQPSPMNRSPRRITVAATRLTIVASIGFAAMSFGILPSEVGHAQAPDSDAIGGSALTMGAILSTEEVAAFDALGRGDYSAGYSLFLGLLRTAIQKGEVAADERDRVSALAHVWWGVVEDHGYHERAAKDLGTLPPHETVLWMLGECARVRGDLVALSWVEQELGCIPGWIVAGPFDNERGAGFSQAFLSEGSEGIPGTTGENITGRPEHVPVPNFDQAFKGRGGHDIGWRPIPVSPRLGSVDLDAIFRPNDHVSAYAATIIDAANAGPARLSISSNDGLRVWLNGRELACATRQGNGEVGLSYGANVHRDQKTEQNQWDIALARGPNVLMLKVMDEEGPWGFSARVQSLNGERVTLMPPSERTTWENKLPAEFVEVDGDAGRPIIGPEKLVDSRSRFWAGLDELGARRTERKDRVAYHLLSSVREALREGAPTREGVHVLYALSRAAKSTAETKAGAEENERVAMLQEIIALDPKYVPALMALAYHYTNHLRILPRAESFARRVLAISPGHSEASMLLARIAAEQGLSIEYQRICRDLIADGNGTSGLHRWLAHMAMRGDNLGLIRANYTKAIELDARDWYSREWLMRDAVRRGDLDTYMAHSQKAESFAPLDVSILVARAQVLGNHGREMEAMTLLRRALTIAPHDDELLVDAGEMAQRVAFSAKRSEDIGGVQQIDGRPVEAFSESHRQQAIEWYRLAVERNSTRADIREHVEFMDSSAPAWETALVQDITPRIRGSFEKTYPTDASAHWLWMDTITVVNPDGTSVRHVHAAIKATNDKGQEGLRQLILWARGHARVLEAKVHSADGAISPGKATEAHVANPPLALGDVVEIRWRASDTEKGYFGDTFGDIVPLGPDPAGASIGSLVAAANTLAVDTVRATWLLSPGKQLYFHTANGVPPAYESTLDGMRLVRYELNDVARLEPEPQSLPDSQVRPTVYVSSFKDWAAFGAWYWNLIERQVKTTPAITAKVAELTDGLEMEVEKAKAIYHWVVTAIRYNDNWEFGVHGYKPYEAGAIFDRCIGDCKDKAILIVTMLREAGITAWPVIINADTSRGREDLTLAMPHHFNHAIAFIEFSDGTKRFVDGTATYVSWDDGLPDMDMGARVLVVRPGGGEMVDIPPAKAAENRDQWDFTLNLKANGSGVLTAANAPLGTAASRWRQVLEAEGQRAATLTELLGEVSVGAQVTSVETAELSDLNQAVKFGFTADTPKAAQVAPDGLTVRIPGSLVMTGTWAQTAWGFMATRQSDMRLIEGLGERATWVVMPPNGMTLKDLPAAVTVSDPHFTFSQTFERVTEGPQSGGVRVVREWGTTANIVEAKAYPAFRQALLRTDQASATTLRFVAE